MVDKPRPGGEHSRESKRVPLSGSPTQARLPGPAETPNVSQGTIDRPTPVRPTQDEGRNPRNIPVQPTRLDSDHNPGKGISDRTQADQDTSNQPKEQDTSNRPREGQDAPDRPREGKEPLGRPSGELIATQVEGLKEAMGELRESQCRVREVAADIKLEESDRKRLEQYLETVDIARRYVDEKLSVLEDINSNPEDLLHITVFVTLHFQEAIHGGEDLEGALPDTLVAEQTERQPGTRGLKRVISDLRAWIMTALRTFSSLVLGLLTPKEWTLSGELTAPVFFSSATARVEIKFGK